VSAFLSKVCDVGDLPVQVLSFGFGNWVSKAEWLSGLWNCTKAVGLRFLTFLTFFQISKTWLFTFFWVVAHVFSITAWNALPSSLLVGSRLTVVFRRFRRLTTHHSLPSHSVIPCLKPSFSVNPSHRNLPFRHDWLWQHGFPGLLTDTSDHVRFYFLVFFSTFLVFGSVR